MVSKVRKRARCLRTDYANTAELQVSVLEYAQGNRQLCRSTSMLAMLADLASAIYDTVCAGTGEHHPSHHYRRLVYAACSLARRSEPEKDLPTERRVRLRTSAQHDHQPHHVQAQEWPQQEPEEEQALPQHPYSPGGLSDLRQEQWQADQMGQNGFGDEAQLLLELMNDSGLEWFNNLFDQDISFAAQ